MSRYNNPRYDQSKGKRNHWDLNKHWPLWIALSRWVSARVQYCDVIMSTMASQITSLTIVYSIDYSGTDQRKHQSSASLAFVRGIHRWLVNPPHKGPVTQKMFSFDDFIMANALELCLSCTNLSIFSHLWKGIPQHQHQSIVATSIEFGFIST